jgi:hypothetical protein
MAKLTWLGEDDLHDGVAGPSFCVGFGGIKFPKGKPVEVTDKSIIERAKKNHFFEVEGPYEFVSLHPELKRGRPTNAERAARMTREEQQTAQIDQAVSK